MSVWNITTAHGERVNVRGHTMHDWTDIDPHERFELESGYPEQIHRYLIYDGKKVLAAAKPVQEIVRQGIYFLVRDGTVEYVGQSVNLYGRLATHEKLKNDHSIAFLPVKEKKYLGIVETYYIEYFNPTLNIRKVADSLDTFRWKESLNRFRLKQWEERR